MDIQGDTLFNKATEETLLLSLNIFIEKKVENGRIRKTFMYLYEEISKMQGYMFHIYKRTQQMPF